jgi:hypothetical protein
MLTEIVLDWTLSMVQDWISVYNVIHVVHISRFWENGKIQILLLSYSFNKNLQYIFDHRVKDHKAFKLKFKERILEEKSGKWGFQTKDFDFITGDTLTVSIF